MPSGDIVLGQHWPRQWMAPSHYVNQSWFLINEVLWLSPESNFTMSAQADVCILNLKIILFELLPHLFGIWIYGKICSWPPDSNLRYGMPWYTVPNFTLCMQQSLVRWILYFHLETFPDSKVHGANMGPIWGRQNPGGPHVGPINFAIWVKAFFGGFIVANINIYIYVFLSFRNFGISQVVEIIRHEVQRFVYCLLSVPGLLMAWCYKETWHQHLWYWPNYTRTFIFQHQKC